MEPDDGARYCARRTCRKYVVHCRRGQCACRQAERTFPLARNRDRWRSALPAQMLTDHVLSGPDRMRKLQLRWPRPTKLVSPIERSLRCSTTHDARSRHGDTLRADPTRGWKQERIDRGGPRGVRDRARVQLPEAVSGRGCQLRLLDVYVGYPPHAQPQHRRDRAASEEGPSDRHAAQH